MILKNMVIILVSQHLKMIIKNKRLFMADLMGKFWVNNGVLYLLCQI